MTDWLILQTTNRKWYTVYHTVNCDVNCKLWWPWVTVVQQMTRFQLTQHVARSLWGSWASCFSNGWSKALQMWYTDWLLQVLADWWNITVEGPRWGYNHFLTFQSFYFRTMVKADNSNLYTNWLFQALQLSTVLHPKLTEQNPQATWIIKWTLWDRWACCIHVITNHSDIISYPSIYAMIPVLRMTSHSTNFTYLF